MFLVEDFFYILLIYLNVNILYFFSGDLSRLYHK